MPGSLILRDPLLPDQPLWTLERLLSLAVAGATLLAVFLLPGWMRYRDLFATAAGLVCIWFPELGEVPERWRSAGGWTLLLLPWALEALLHYLRSERF